MELDQDLGFVGSLTMIGDQFRSTWQVSLVRKGLGTRMVGLRLLIVILKQKHTFDILTLTRQ